MKSDRKAITSIVQSLYRLANDIEKRSGHIPDKADDWLALFVSHQRSIAKHIESHKDKSPNEIRQIILKLKETDDVLTYAQTSFLVIFHQQCQAHKTGPYTRHNN